MHGCKWNTDSTSHLGNSAYTVKSWQICPFQDNRALAAACGHFNKELSKACIADEHGFGGTKIRWRCLDKRMDKNTMNIFDTVSVCCLAQR